MNKYKASFLPTGRSRKMRSLFFYASNDTAAIAMVEERVREQHPDGEVISLQGPNRQFMDLGVAVTGAFADLTRIPHSLVEDAKLTDATVQRILKKNIKGSQCFSPMLPTTEEPWNNYDGAKIEFVKELEEL